MRLALVILVGAALVLGLPGAPALYVTVGSLAGLVMMLAEARWPSAKPIYIDPLSRPKLTTPMSGYTAAVLTAAGGAMLAIVAWNLVLPRLPEFGYLGVYLAAAGVGMAAGMVLTARQVSDAHNRWLTSMTPRSDSDI